MPGFGRLSILCAILVFLGACAGKPSREFVTEQESVVFQHDFSGTAVPWTNTSFDNGKEKFTFALFSDLTGGEREGVFDVAMEQLRLLRPELIANLRLSGIFDKTGKIPLNGNEICLQECANK